MEFRVLGPLALERGHASALPGTLRRRLLAALLVRHNTVVPADRLASILWGDEDGSRSAARNLHNQVWRLRAALDECAPGAAQALLTQPPGYLLRVDPD